MAYATLTATLHDTVIREHTAAVDRAALGEFEWNACTRRRKHRDALAQENRVDVEAHLLDEPRGQEWARELSATHETDPPPWLILQTPHESHRVIADQRDAWYVDGREGA